MKRAILLVALLLVLSAIPASVARHRSMGAEDHVIVDRDEEPTVPGAGADSPYQVGITPTEDCYDPRAEVTQAEAERSASAHGFCSALRYNENLPDELEVVSPKDQHIPGDLGGSIGDNPIESFDVVRADAVNPIFAFTLCTPFCPPGEEFLIPGSVGNAGHEVFYDTGSELGLTNDSETTNEEQRNNRRQWTAVLIGYPNAAQVAQSQTGVWEMNGWMSPSPTYTFVAFPEDSNGKVISADRLESIVQGSSLSDAGATVCGFSPDFNITISGGSDAAVCELPFRYFEAEEGEDPSFTEYGDRCQSPTYLCNQAAGPSWRTTLALHTFFNYLGNAEELFWEDVIGADANNFREWHFVVGPRAPDCSAQEPGFLTNKGGATAPYLAHDLDVYTPTTKLDGAAEPSAGPVMDYTDTVSANGVDTLSNTVDNNTDLPPEVEKALDDALSAASGAVNDTFDLVDQVNRQVSDTQNTTLGDLSKASRMEPNADPARNPLADSSSSQISHSRAGSLGDSACARVLSEESPATLDPWVDRIDAGVEVTATQTTLYGNNDTGQDDENNPGPDRFSTAGNLGLFTDKNDDGDYDTTGDQFTIPNIEGTGAYPMIWDVRTEVTDSGGAQITDKGACEFGSNNHNLALEAQRLGYGPNTGLYQLIYLQEPTTFDTGLVTDNRVVYSSGNNIYLLASQPVKELWEGPDKVDPGATDDFPLDNEVDRAVQALQEYADKNNGEALGEPDVKLPGDEFGFKSDIEAQCEENTGGFDTLLSFTHDCQMQNCEGDTILTQYVFEVATDTLRFEDNAKTAIPFHAINDVTADFEGFPAQINTWTDVDPLDGDPDRNDDGTEGPPTGS